MTSVEHYGIIYVWTNTVNGKRYVGQTTDIETRKCHHIRYARSGKKSAFYNAFRKYGEHSFILEIIHVCFNKEELDFYEDHYIKTLNTLTPNGYNLKGGGARGKFSEEMRINHSRILKAALSTPEARQNMSEAQKAACSRPEVIERKSAASKEVNSRPGLNERRVAKLKETWAKPEIKEAFLAAVRSDEHREKMRQLSSATMADPEARARNSAITTQLMQDPDYRQRHKDAHNTPEFIAWVKERTTGTIWVNDGATSRRIKADEPIPAGWQPGQLYGGDPEVRKRIQLLARHTRWHVNRGTISLNCQLCNLLNQN